MDKKTLSPVHFFHPSNLLTYLAMGLSLWAMSVQNFSYFGAVLAVCVLLDLFDGKFAGLFKRNEKLKAFGVQIDSFSDAISFGILPATAVYHLAGSDNYIAGVVSFFYLTSAITRLGYYNLISSETGGFTGLPTTLSGLILSYVFYCDCSTQIIISSLVVTGVLMVAPFKIKRPGIKVFATIVLLSLISLAMNLNSILHS